jgi:hypothetical protein
MKNRRMAFRSNTRLAIAMWGSLSRAALIRLKELTGKFALSVAAGDLQLLEGKWYITHSGLLRVAHRRHCLGIRTIIQKDLSDPSLNHWVFKSTVYKSIGSKGFVGYGDADPSNTSPLVRGAEMRVAETRAVNRALRKAYGVGLCSVEELGWIAEPPKSSGNHRQQAQPQTSNRNQSNNGQPRLRDRLCVLIRRFNLDPTLVKAYAADFCGTETLAGATRDLVESFINHLGATAKEDRDALIRKLNSYAQPVEVQP